MRLNESVKEERHDDKGLLEGQQSETDAADKEEEERVSLVQQRKNIMKEIISNLKEFYKHPVENLTQPSFSSSLMKASNLEHYTAETRSLASKSTQTSSDLVPETKIQLNVSTPMKRNLSSAYVKLQRIDDTLLSSNLESLSFAEVKFEPDDDGDERQKDEEPDNWNSMEQQHSDSDDERKSKPRSTKLKQTKPRVQCAYCPKSFSRPVVLEAHTNTVHLKIKPYSCTLCPATYSCADYLQKHRRIEHGLGKTSSDTHHQGGLNANQSSSNVETLTVSFKCMSTSGCSFEGKNETQLMAHVLAEHKESAESQNRHMCPKCGKDYQRNIKLRTHELQVHGQSSQVWSCTQPGCTQSFLSSIFPRDHEKTPNSNQKEVKTEFNSSSAAKPKPKLKQANAKRSLKCPHCNKFMSSKHALQMHINRHLNLKPYSCQVCSRSFSSQQYLRDHATLHPELDQQQLQTLSCPDCDKTFLHQRHLFIHRALHEKSVDPESVANRKIRRQIKQRLRRRQKLINAEKKNRLQLCILTQGSGCCHHSQCEDADGFTAETQEELLLHVQKVHFLAPESNIDAKFKFICLHCGADYARVVDLRKHELSLHGSITRSWSCTWENCGTEEFSTQLRLRQHIQDVHFANTINPPLASSSSPTVVNPKHSTPPLHKCPQCPSAIITTRTSFRTHMNGHGNLRPYACETCNFATTRPQYLKHHRTKHPQLNLHQIKCPDSPDCHKTFSTPNYLRVHRLTIHAKEHKVTCEHCGYGTYYEATLRQHIAAVHVGGKEYVCETCGLKFKHSYNLKVHRRNHTGERPYVCVTCSKGFMSREALNRHSAIHGGDLRYECRICDKKFPVQNYLYIHMKSHNNKKEKKKKELVGSTT